MSTAEWLRAIDRFDLPDGWRLVSVGSRYDIQLGKMLNADRAAEPDSPGAAPYLRNVNVQWGRIDTHDLKWMRFSPDDRAKYALRRGDLLVCEGGEIGRCAIWDSDREDCFFQKALMRVRSRGPDRLDWLARCMRAVADGGALSAGAEKSTIDHLPAEKLRALRIPLPEPGQQRLILCALDAETTRIDALISARQRQSDLFAERAAVAASALCLRGGGGSVGYRNSGIEPVGDIPEQWRTLRNKVFLREIADLSADGAEELLTVSHLTGVTTRAEKTEVTMFKAESTVGYKRCAPGDLIINTMWAWMGALGIARQHGIVSPAYGVYRFDREIADPSYFEHVFRSSAYVAEMTRYSKGVWSSRLRLYPEAFLGLSAPVPPLGEQRWIVESIRQQTKGDADLRDGLRRSIDLLRERRQALLTAAITGKLQVPTASTANAAA